MNEKYYLINNYFLVMTNVNYDNLKKVMKEQFDIDVYSIKSLTLEEYINLRINLKNMKTKTKYFIMEEKWKNQIMKLLQKN